MCLTRDPHSSGVWCDDKMQTPRDRPRSLLPTGPDAPVAGPLGGAAVPCPSACLLGSYAAAPGV